MNARILIVTNGHLCRNPRPLKEATALGRAGYDVTVLGVRNHRPSLAHDAGLLQHAPFRCAMVDMLDLGRPAVLARRLRVWLARRAARPASRSVASLGPAARLLADADRFRADLTIVHNEVPHWVGTRLIARGRRVAADIEDWHSEDLPPDARLGRPIALLRDTERFLLQRAIHTTTTSHALAAALQARYGGRRPAVITNAFPLHPHPRGPATQGVPSFFWFSQTIGAGRGLEEFVTAWARTEQPSRLVLLGEPHGAFAQRLADAVPATRRDAVTFLPLVPPADLPAAIASHDIGLALEQPGIPSRNLTITNKILQYLNAGLAVVASDTAGQREVLGRGPGAGILVSLADPDATTAALDGLLADREALGRRQQAARRLAEEVYCWEREEPALLALIGAALTTTIPD